MASAQILRNRQKKEIHRQSIFEYQVLVRSLSTREISM